MDSPWMLTLAAWLGTYLLHSTVLLGVTFLVLRWWRRLPDRCHETLWRVALFGSFLTAALQLNLGLGPNLGHLELPVPASIATGDTPVLSPLPELAPSVLSTGAATVPEPAGNDDRWFGLGLGLLLWLWAGGVLVLAMLHAGGRVRLHWLLADRAPVAACRLRQRFRQLARRAGLQPTIRFTTSTRIRCPMAFGVLRPEVCLPARIAAGMDFDQQGCVLAHELAHLRARDPLWLLLGAVAAWVGFLQPLNRLACRRARELAEYRCDAWAVRHGGSHLHMANALMSVAESYLAAGEPVPIYAGVNAMAMGRSALGRRVERIFADAGDPGPVGRSVLLASVMLGLAAIALAVPGVSLTQVGDESTETTLDTLDTPDPTDPRLKRLRLLEKELRHLRSELRGIRDSLVGSLQHPDVLSILNKLEQRVRELQSEQQALWREAVDAARPEPHPNKRSRR